jgi:hypothetical protein
MTLIVVCHPRAHRRSHHCSVNESQVSNAKHGNHTEAEYEENYLQTELSSLI